MKTKTLVAGLASLFLFFLACTDLSMEPADESAPEIQVTQRAVSIPWPSGLPPLEKVGEMLLDYLAKGPGATMPEEIAALYRLGEPQRTNALARLFYYYLDGYGYAYAIDALGKAFRLGGTALIILTSLQAQGQAGQLNAGEYVPPPTPTPPPSSVYHECKYDFTGAVPTTADLVASYSGDPLTPNGPSNTYVTCGMSCRVDGKLISAALPANCTSSVQCPATIPFTLQYVTAQFSTSNSNTTSLSSPEGRRAFCKAVAGPPLRDKCKAVYSAMGNLGQKTLIGGYFQCTMTLPPTPTSGTTSPTGPLTMPPSQ